MPFEFEKLAIPDVVLVKPVKFGDERGFFMETYKRSDFMKAGITEEFVQDNHSRSVKGVLRGLHYQNPPGAQGKLVRCTRGKIFDVAVDIRRGSPHYSKWIAMELSSENAMMLYIPPGFAHGFLTLSGEADVMYKTTFEYSPDDEAGIFWDDPEIGIDWMMVEGLSISEKDSALPRLEDADNLFVFSGSDK